MVYRKLRHFDISLPQCRNALREAYVIKIIDLIPLRFSSTAPMAKMTPVTDKIRRNSEETRAKAKCAYRQMDSVITAPYLILQNGYNPSLLYALPILPVLLQSTHLSRGYPVPTLPILSANYSCYSDL